MPRISITNTSELPGGVGRRPAFLDPRSPPSGRILLDGERVALPAQDQRERGEYDEVEARQQDAGLDIANHPRHPLPPTRDALQELQHASGQTFLRSRPM